MGGRLSRECFGRQATFPRVVWQAGRWAGDFLENGLAGKRSGEFPESGLAGRLAGGWTGRQQCMRLTRVLLPLVGKFANWCSFGMFLRRLQWLKSPRMMKAHYAKLTCFKSVQWCRGSVCEDEDRCGYSLTQTTIRTSQEKFY